MKRYVLLAAVVVILGIPGMAWSQSGPSGAGAPPPPPPPVTGGSNGGQGGNGQDFQTRKTEILKRMNGHLAEVQQRIGCVQAAANPEALRACMLARREGGRGGQDNHGKQ